MNYMDVCVGGGCVRITSRSSKNDADQYDVLTWSALPRNTTMMYQQPLPAFSRNWNKNFKKALKCIV